MASSSPASRHFALHEVAEGVYAVVASDEGGAGSNAGIVDLGDSTLIFDTLLTPQAAEDLRAAAERLTGRAPALVVNSHWHGDHVLGNQAFAGAEIVATGRTRELVELRTGESVARLRSEAAELVRPLEERLAREADEAARRELRADIAARREILAALPTLALTPPTRVFDERLTLRGSRWSAELLTYGGGHTESDAFLYLPERRVLFAGDLVVIQTHPWMGHGDPASWPTILDRLDALDIATLVPGHGPVGGRDAIAPVRAYLADVVALASELAGRAASAEEAAQAPIPERYASWAAREMFGSNMAFLHERMRARGPSGKDGGA